MRPFFWSFLVTLVIGLATLAVLAYTGLYWPNMPSYKDYPVRGVDVSHHQGDIDWHKIKDQGIHFAYMKATEGGDFQDTKFQQNWIEAKKAGLRVGAYHFFTAKTDGALQAENFIRSVPKEHDMLPPVIDVENEVVDDSQEVVAITQRLRVLLQKIEDHYGVRPIIYTDEYAYPVYVQPQFADYPLWYRSILSEPNLPQGTDWVIWQYNPKGLLKGYQGREKHIDLNVFNGSHEVFAEFGKAN